MLGGLSSSRRLGRRAFLKGAAAALGAALLPRLASGRPGRPPISSGSLASWSDVSTWNGAAPGPRDFVRVSRPILIDRSVQVAGVVIEPGGELVFDPKRDVTLRTRKNVIVRGRLVMQPASANIVHRLVFKGVNESRFVGGGQRPLATDVGLWVMGRGQLSLRGTAKRGWMRAARGVRAGSRKIRFRRSPRGWEAGDELIITPTARPTSPGFDTGFERVKIRAVRGRTVVLSRKIRRPHPRVLGRGPEVLNLTRNVRIEGTRKGRAHVLIRSRSRQIIKHAGLRHMGPRQPTAEGNTENVAGRHPLHFHMSRNGSRGSVVAGVVARDSGGHAFVPHLSHGITFRDCIAYNVHDAPYWWPGPPDTRTDGPPSHRIKFVRCIAAKVLTDPPFRGFRLAAFVLGAGNGNVCIRCTAVGVLGNKNASGFEWPEGTGDSVWRFENNLAHNNRVNGIFVWQNTGKVHPVDDFVAYHNGQSGIEHGAYGNAYQYRGAVLLANGQASVILHGEGTGPGTLRFQKIVAHGDGISEYGFLAVEPAVDLEGHRAIVCGTTISGTRVGDFGVAYAGDTVADRFDIRNGC